MVILDGYGFSEETTGNAVAAACTPFLDGLFTAFPHTLIRCSGMAVGLPEGQMGNSEVGHLNIGAGRVVYQELTRITKSIDDGDFFTNAAFLKAVSSAKAHNGALHIMGLVSDGGVHSELSHLKALIKLAHDNGLKRVFVHCFTDGRDTPPQSAGTYINELEDYLRQLGTGAIATVCGRYYAMDRDKRYDRVKKAYDALTAGIGDTAESAAQAVAASYAGGVNDEFIVPCVITENGKPIATINDGDSVIFFNFRADRARELTDALSQRSFSGFARDRYPSVEFVCMTLYDASFMGVDIAFAPELLKNTLGEYLSSLGLKQLRIAETEKYAHVTYFFNGGVEQPNSGEDRVVIPSPKVATYDLQPEMSAYKVTDELINRVESDQYAFIVVNYANCDMVGHTGDFAAAVKAVEAVDRCVARLYYTCREHGYTMLLTADHGNAEEMLKDGAVVTAHSTNPVCFTVTDRSIATLQEGSLCDIAPTVLKVMKLPQPAEMTGKPLF